MSRSSLTEREKWEIYYFMTYASRRRTQTVVGDFYDVSQSTISRICKEKAYEEEILRQQHRVRELESQLSDARQQLIDIGARALAEPAVFIHALAHDTHLAGNQQQLLER